MTFKTKVVGGMIASVIILIAVVVVNGKLKSPIPGQQSFVTDTSKAYSPVSQFSKIQKGENAFIFATEDYLTEEKWSSSWCKNNDTEERWDHEAGLTPAYWNMLNSLPTSCETSNDCALIVLTADKDCPDHDYAVINRGAVDTYKTTLASNVDQYLNWCGGRMPGQLQSGAYIAFPWCYAGFAPQPVEAGVTCRNKKCEIVWDRNGSNNYADAPQYFIKNPSKKP